MAAMIFRSLILLVALCCGVTGIAGAASAAADPPPRGMSFEVFIRLEHGMTEGELVLRAGKPDHQSIDNYRDGLKSFYYYPTLAHPFLTTVTLRAGRITGIERTRKTY